jgi:hypothetical protein
MTRDYRRVGRSGRASATPYHIEKHKTALHTALLMREMLDAGLDRDEVGKRFGISGAAVYNRLKRQGLLK